MRSLFYHDVLCRCARHRKELNVAGLEHGLNQLVGSRVDIVEADHVDLVDHNEDELVGEEGLDTVEELDLCCYRITARFAKVLLQVLATHSCCSNLTKSVTGALTMKYIIALRRCAIALPTPCQLPLELI